MHKKDDFLNFIRKLKKTLFFSIFGLLDAFALGETVQDERTGFSIDAPAGWEVSANTDGATFLFQAPFDESAAYRRNIRIMSFSGSRYIDDVSLNEFVKEIEEKSTKMSNLVSNYRVRDLTLIELADQSPAGLFYADFYLDQIAMMQMRILISSQTNHYLLTYTDIQENFENSGNGYLDEAYQAFLTAKLPSRAPGRSDLFKSVIPIVCGLLGICLLFSIYRRFQINRLGRGIKEYEDDYVGDPTPTEEDRIDDMPFSDSDVFSSKQSLRLSKRKKKTPRSANDEISDHEFDDDDDDWKLNG